MTKPIGVLGILANALIATACNGQDGQATFDYLKAEVHIVKQGKRNLEVRHLPKPPTPPVFTKQTKPKDRLTQKKEYRESLALYYTNVIQVTTESEKLLNHVQNQLSALNGLGVAREAIDFASLQEQALGDVAQIRLKLRSWASRAQEDMQKPHERDVVIPHLVLGVVELMEGSPLGLGQIGKGMSEQAKVNSEKLQEKQAEQLRLDDSVTALEDARTTLASDVAKLLTKRNQLITTLGAEYPQFAWKSLFAQKSQNGSLPNPH